MDCLKTYPGVWVELYPDGPATLATLKDTVNWCECSDLIHSILCGQAFDLGQRIAAVRAYDDGGYDAGEAIGRECELIDLARSLGLEP